MNKHTALEALESRIAPASIVTVILADGNLTVSSAADDTAAQVLGFSAVAGGIRISPANDVQLQIGKNATPLAAGAFADISGVTGNIKILTFGGNDSVSFGDITVPRGVTVDAGAGDDSVFLTNFTAGGSVKVLTGDGVDGIGLFGTQFQAAGPVSFLTGEGNGTVYLAADTITIPKSLTIKGGTGEDTVSTSFLAIASAKNANLGALMIDHGAGVSTVTITPATKLDVAKDITLTAKNASAEAANIRIGSPGDIEVGGKVAATFGSGTNSFILGADRNVSALGQSVSVIGKITALGGAGSDKFIIGAKTITAAGITAKLGDGTNDFTLGVDPAFNLEPVITITGRITYLGGLGNDSIDFGANSLAASGVAVKANTGINVLQTSANSVTVPGTVAFSANGGSLGASSCTLGGSAIALGSLRCSYECASFTNIIGTVDIARDIAISGSGGDTNIILAANGNIGGKFSVALGTGTAHGVVVGAVNTGSLAITSAAPTTIQLDSATVRGATNLKLGSGVDVVEITSSTFAKAVSINLGAGNDGIGIEGPMDTGTSTFSAAVKIDLGKGNDNALFGTGGGTTMVNFNALWKLIGGEGANTATVQAGNVNEPAGHIFTDII